MAVWVAVTTGRRELPHHAAGESGYTMGCVAGEQSIRSPLSTLPSSPGAQRFPVYRPTQAPSLCRHCLPQLPSPIQYRPEDRRLSRGTLQEGRPGPGFLPLPSQTQLRPLPVSWPWPSDEDIRSREGTRRPHHLQGESLESFPMCQHSPRIMRQSASMCFLQTGKCLPT